MITDDVLAVIVSYNGLSRTRQAVDALRGQVGRIHIVDNGSDTASLEVLASLEREAAISVARLGENRGIGHALNLGVKSAAEMGCSWLLTMDQDSVVDGSMLRAYQAAVERDPKLVSLAPTLATTMTKKAEGGLIDYAITSGNLVRVSLFDEIGLYDEGFFIDCIDFDFCLRLRRAGHAVHRIPEALMQHQVGEAHEGPGFLRRYYTQHSAIRRYYQYRNVLYLMERYSLGFPKFIAKLALAQLAHLLLIAILDPSPLKSYRAIARGMRDYFARKQGPYGENA